MGVVSLRCCVVSTEPTPEAAPEPSTAPTLAVTAHGSGSTVAVVHGFGQNRSCLGPLLPALAETHRVLAVDAPGHGASGLDEADLCQGADALVRTVATSGPAHLVGYSMGGRLCLHAALAHPGSVRSLVLISSTAGLRGDAARAERRASDEALAARLEQIGVAAFMDEWLSLELFADLPPSARFERERSSNTAAGLAASLRRCGTGAMASLWPRLSELTCPVLLLSGARDDKFTRLAAEMAASIGPSARRVVVPDAGHAVHLVAPAATAAVIGDFLDVAEGTESAEDARR